MTASEDVSKEKLIRDLTQLREQIRKMEQSLKDRTRFHDELIRARAMFEGLFEFSPDAIIVVSPNGNISRVNKQAEEMFGYSRAKLADLHIETLLPERFREKHFKHRQDYMSDPHIRPMGTGLELYGRRQDGSEFAVDIALGPFNVGGEIFVIAVIRDVSGIKKERDLLKKSTAELTETLKELEAFSYSVSHDLRAPLRHMSGYVQLLEKRLREQPDEKAQHYATAIAAASIKMGLLIDDLLAFSRMGRIEMKKRKVGLNALVKEILRDIENDVKGRDMNWEIDELPEVYGDKSMLKIALSNLISNAVKFTRTRHKAEIRISCKDEGGEFICSIKDNGVGFDMRYADKLFGVFQRLHPEREFEGTGVGLANVRRIVARHGGRTWAESTVGQGATFYFTLPVANNDVSG